MEEHDDGGPVDHGPLLRDTFEFRIEPQPDDTTCGPTALHSIYRHFGDDMPLAQVIDEVHALEGGGTLGVMLGCHALRRGYSVTLYNYNLQTFDPTWFGPNPVDLREKLRRQSQTKEDPKLRLAIDAYLEYLEQGGAVRMEDLSSRLLRHHLKRSEPILTGLNSNWLYRSSREDPATNKDDDVGGYPAGHFVVLTGYEQETRMVFVADPYISNPDTRGSKYKVGIDRLIGSILLGVLTYDGNFLVIRPKEKSCNRSSSSTV